MRYTQTTINFSSEVHFGFLEFVFLSAVDMVKLTAELIEQAAQYTNPVRDRELDLRGESTLEARAAQSLFSFYSIKT